MSTGALQSLFLARQGTVCVHFDNTREHNTCISKALLEPGRAARPLQREGAGNLAVTVVAQSHIVDLAFKECVRGEGALIALSGASQQ